MFTMNVLKKDTNINNNQFEYINIRAYWELHSLSLSLHVSIDDRTMCSWHKEDSQLASELKTLWNRK